LLDGDAVVGDELAGLVVGAGLDELVGDLGSGPAVEGLALAFAVLPAQIDDADPAAVHALGDGALAGCSPSAGGHAPRSWSRSRSTKSRSAWIGIRRDRSMRKDSMAPARRSS